MPAFIPRICRSITFESTPNTAPEIVTGAAITVVAGAILDRTSTPPKVLLAQRLAQAHQGGKWEFPGGKGDLGEAARETLARELQEEIGIEVITASRLIDFPFAYPEFNMDFQVFQVTEWRGTPRGCEGQKVRWFPITALRDLSTPPASHTVIRALELPRRYAISPTPSANPTQWLAELQDTLACGVRLIQLRAHGHGEDELKALAIRAIPLVHEAGAKMVLNADPALALAVGADGVHLTRTRLMQCKRRPLADDLWVGASCHNGQELRQAQTIGADFAVLSPVRHTQGALNFSGFEALIAESALPVYALGGMCETDVSQAIDCGGQGIAAIRGLWRGAADQPNTVPTK